MCALPIFYISAGVPAFVLIKNCRKPVVIVLDKVRTPEGEKRKLLSKAFYQPVTPPLPLNRNSWQPLACRNNS